MSKWTRKHLKKVVSKIHFYVKYEFLKTIKSKNIWKFAKMILNIYALTLYWFDIFYNKNYGIYRQDNYLKRGYPCLTLNKTNADIMYIMK